MSKRAGVVYFFFGCTAWCCKEGQRALVSAAVSYCHLAPWAPHVLVRVGIVFLPFPPILHSRDEHYTLRTFVGRCRIGNGWKGACLRSRMMFLAVIPV